MRRERQTTEDLLAQLSPVASDWKDAHSDAVIALLNRLPNGGEAMRDTLADLFRTETDAAITSIRLALDLSKDEFEMLLKRALAARKQKLSQLKQAKADIVGLLEEFGAFAAFEAIASSPVTWQSVLAERLKSGRGSAIKGQRRGRVLEDFVEDVVREVFNDRYETRCRFRGADGRSTEKADFAIPDAEEPRILIEVKAYGATGSKQTDVLGDFQRIVEQKRRDVELLLVTDGVTWLARVNDLRRLVEMQNQGDIGRIYTMKMRDQLAEDLRDLRNHHCLHPL